MAPVKFTTNQDTSLYVAIGFYSTFAVLVIICGCCKGKKKKQVEEKAQDAKGEGAAVPSGPIGAQQVAVKGKEQISVHIPDVASSKKESQPTPVSKTSASPFVSVQVKKIVQVTKSTTTAKLPQTASKSSAKSPAKLPIAFPAEPKSIGSTKSGPNSVTKSLPATPAPKLTATMGPVGKTIPDWVPPPPGKDDFLQVHAASVVTPQPGGSPKHGHGVPLTKDDMEYVPSDNPAYRSLIGLDDAFGGTLRPTNGTSTYGKKAGADSYMPSVAVSVVTPSPSTSSSAFPGSSTSGSATMRTKQKTKAVKDKKVKKKPQKGKKK